MKFIVIDDVTVATNRICFYFGFTPESKVIFAAKTNINSAISQIKSESIHEVFAWMGFNNLAFGLFNSSKFSRRYRTSVSEIIQNQLNIITVNDDSAYYFKSDDSSWQWTYDVEDLKPSMGADIEGKIESILGKNFCKSVQEKLELEKKLESNFKQSASELKALETKISEEIAKPNNGTNQTTQIDKSSLEPA